jgi:hypothetical protein
LAKKSVPSSPPSDAHIPRQVRQDYLRRLDRLIPHLWKVDTFLRWRQGFSGIQAHLRHLRDTGDQRFLPSCYAVVLGLSGIGVGLPGGGAAYDPDGRVQPGVLLPSEFAEPFEQDVSTMLLTDPDAPGAIIFMVAQG